MTAPPEADAGDTAPVVDVSSGDEDAPEENAAGSFLAEGRAGATPGPADRSRTAIAAVLGVAIVVIGSLGIWAAVAAHGLRAAAASANAAVVNESATRSVERAVTVAVNTIFSYSYADTARTKAAAQQVLTGPAIRQYNQLFALVQQQAPKEKLVVTTRVTDIGVELLTGGRARLLVFADQQDSRAGTSEATYGGAMFAVTAVNESGRWRIESIDTFTGPS
jgi:Mce-associated membrane protein